MRMAAALCFLGLLSGADAAVQLVENHVIQTGPPFRLAQSGAFSSAVSPCGRIAIAFGNTTQGTGGNLSTSIYEADAVTGAGTVIPASTEVFTAFDIAYDDDCRLNYVESYQDWIFHYRYNGTSFEPVYTAHLPITIQSGALPRLVDFFRGRDDRLHAVWHVRGSFSAEVPEHGMVVGTFDGAAWSFQQLPFGDATVFAVEVTTGGHLLVLHPSPGDFEFANDLVLSTYFAGQWTEQVVMRAPEQDFFPSTGDMELPTNDSPRIVATFTKTVETGSPVYTRLDYFEKSGPTTFARTNIASQGDGYFGDDGNKYTGSAPRIVVDDTGATHVTFFDISGWHSGGFARSIAGQWRHAYRPAGGGGWSITKLFSQPGQAQDDSPLHSLQFAGWTVSNGGGHINLLAAEVLSDTPPSSSAAINSLNLRHFRAANDQGSDLAPGIAQAIDVVLGRRVIGSGELPALDGDGNGSIDSADVTRF